MQLLRESLARKRRGEKGFSFIELVIVVAVVGILTAIAIPSYGAIQSNAKQSAVEANAQTGYRLVAATIAGFDVKSSATTVGKAKTPAQALASLSVEGEIELAFLDRAGKVVANPDEDFCVWGFDTREVTSGVPRYSSTVGVCPPADVSLTVPGYTPPPTTPPVVTPPSPEPSPEPTEEEPVAIANFTPVNPLPTPKASYGVEERITSGSWMQASGVDNVEIATGTNSQNIWIAGPYGNGSTSAVLHSSNGGARFTGALMSSHNTSSIYYTMALDAANRPYFGANNGAIYQWRGTSLVAVKPADRVAINKIVLNGAGDVLYAQGLAIKSMAIATGEVKEVATVAAPVRNMALTGDSLIFTTKDGAYELSQTGEVRELVRNNIGGIVYTSTGELYMHVSSSIIKLNMETLTQTRVRALNTEARVNAYRSMAMLPDGTIWLKGYGSYPWKL